MKIDIKVEGLAGLDAALGQLTEPTAKRVLRKVATAALQPVAEAARAAAHERFGDLKKSIGVGTKLSRRQAAQARAEDKSYVEVYAGAGANPQSITEEFGTFDQAPRPFLRPAWDQERQNVLSSVANQLGDEIDKAAQRAARRAARG